MQNQVKQAIKIAKQGGIIVFPTDTVYGIGVLFSNEKAVKNLLTIKDRTNNIPLLVSSLSEANEIFCKLPLELENLAKKYWPGGLTIVHKSKHKYFLGYDDLDTVAIRVPNNEVALNILKETGPMAVTSANKHNFPAPTTVEQAKFSDKIDFLVDGGPVKQNISSTIVTFVDGKVKVLRSGAVRI